jgi:hypothetical protein
MVGFSTMGLFRTETYLESIKISKTTRYSPDPKKRNTSEIWRF